MRVLLTLVLSISLACGGNALVADSTDAPVVDGSPNGLALGVCVDAGRCGLIDQEGHWVVAPEYRQVPERCVQGCVLVQADRRRVLVDVSTESVQFTPLEDRDHSEVSEGVLLVWPAGDVEEGSLWKTDGTVLIDGGIARTRVASTVADPRLAQARWAPGSPRTETFLVRDGVAAIQRDGTEYVRVDGTVAFAPGGRSVVHASGGVVVRGEVIHDLSGAVVRSEATVVTPVADGFARGLVNTREGPDGVTGDDVVVDVTGRIVSRPEGLSFDRSLPFSGGRLSAWDIEGEHPVWLVADGTRIDPPADTEQLWSFIEDRGMYGLGGRVGYLDASGAPVIPAAFAMPDTDEVEHAHFSEGLAVARPASDPALAGYVTPDGSWAIEPRFESAERFEAGVARVTIDDVTTWIRQDGSYVLSPDALRGLRAE